MVKLGLDKDFHMAIFGIMTIKEFRLARKMTVKELAEVLNIHWTALYRYESGARKPNLYVTDRIRRYTGGLVDIQDFLSGRSVDAT